MKLGPETQRPTACLLCLDCHPFLSGVKLVLSPILDQLKRDGMLHRSVALRRNVQDVVIGHVHHDELSVGAESEAVFAWLQLRSSNVELRLSNEHALIFLLN